MNGENLDMNATIEAPDQTHEEWLAERKTYLGGTDAAAILGVHPYKSEYEVFLDKRGLTEDQDKDVMRFGREFEPFIATRYTERTGVDLIALPKKAVRHAAYEFIGGNPDRLDASRTFIVEIKTAGAHTATRWGTPGTDEVPEEYLVQGCHYMMVLNLDRVDFILYNRETCETSIYTLGRDIGLENRIMDRLVPWWERHIVADTPPPIDGSKSATEYVKKRFPTASGIEVTATQEIDDIAAKLWVLKKDMKPLFEAKDELENRLKAFMGDASTLVTSIGKISWKNNSPKSEIDWEAVARNFNPSPEIIAAHTTTKPGDRRFLLPR